MSWISRYQLFLFDFDGLLVNTEELHYLAYKKMCRERGFDLKWDFHFYAKHAHYGATAIQSELFRVFPELAQVSWDVLYSEKKRHYQDLVANGNVELMEGARALLSALDEANIRRCVVTHSPKEPINLIRSKLPILETIPHWITREDYEQPKPHPECYLKAIATFANPQDRVIGFEDTPRGLKALVDAGVESVLITKCHPLDQVEAFVGKGFSIYPSFNSLL